MRKFLKRYLLILSVLTSFHVVGANVSVAATDEAIPLGVVCIANTGIEKMFCNKLYRILQRNESFALSEKSDNDRFMMRISLLEKKYQTIYSMALYVEVKRDIPIYLVSITGYFGDKRVTAAAYDLVHDVEKYIKNSCFVEGKLAKLPAYTPPKDAFLLLE